MDTGDIAILVAIGIGVISILVTIVALMWQIRSEMRGESREQREGWREEMRQQREGWREEMREQRRETREQRQEAREQRQKAHEEMLELSVRLGERISDAEREQARLEGANGTLSEVLKQQSHTHEASGD